MFDPKQKSKIDLEELRTFVTVAQLKSFSAAAEVLHKSTAAISYRIKTIEASMDTVLIERTTRKLKLTPSGEMLFEKATQILEWIQTMPDSLKQVNDGIEPNFKLVFNNLIYDPKAASHLLAHLNQRFPLTVFKLEMAVFMGVWDQMQYNDGQLAIGAPGFHAMSDEFQSRAMGVINWLCVAAPDHRLLTISEPITQQELRHYPVVNIEDSSDRLQKRAPWRLAGQQELLVPDMATKITCHEIGLGIGFLPAAIAQEEIAKGRLAELKLARIGRKPSPLSLVWRSSSAGKITAYLLQLFDAQDPLITPFIRLIDHSEPSDY
ncbi:HTH-type transcriptional activator AllS [Serratia oryzae]|uniref:HTH-type transcriptional activator AllS n=1 Tax=Serratia oryzae TaxID=2034155 RepID=UPI0012E25D00|nr:HTH-type transcriptional activator AllS [Serratia oryzae]VXD06259.1 HTH-type transcriptional activator AllS [Enterobacterales bacterium 8AC]